MSEPLMEDYAAWQISEQRQRHEWTLMRRSIVKTRLSIVIFGHSGFFATCLLLNARGVPCSTFIHLGWWSLLLASLLLLLMEFLHVHSLPRIPPRFVVRRSGLTEYGEEGPRTHWDWGRAEQLSIATDHERPAYRSLVVALRSQSKLFQKFTRIYIPLPETEQQINERDIIAAVNAALEDNNIELHPTRGGAVALVPVKRN
ncbi:MAG TPA: hypothetical protein VEK08_26530 [Planctomycetota bacterium]|nr:hypothetical protein [Planctomycetota bacterium]